MKADYVRALGRLGSLLLGLMLSASASAAYVFVELAPLPNGGDATPFGLNNSGQVVGTTEFAAPCFGCGGYTRATLWSGGTATDMGGVGTSNYAFAINDAGQIAGWSHFAYGNSFTQAVRWTAGVATYLYSMGGRSGAYGINSLGHVAGWAMISSTAGSATIWDSSGSATYLGAGSSAVDINDVGQVAGNSDGATLWNGATAVPLVSLSGIAGYSKAEAINNHGEVVGWSFAPGGYYHATLWTTPSPTDLGSLGGHSYAHDINDAGHVVGESYTTGGSLRAFLWNGAEMLDLNDLVDPSIASEWVLVDAIRINEHGQIVGRVRNADTGRISGYLLTPIPTDTTPPQITCSATPKQLFPPNHSLRDVAVVVDVVDGESGSDYFVLLSVTSSEPDYGTDPDDVGGDVLGWTVDTPDTVGMFRAERSGAGKGRVYSLTYRGFDKAGNHADCVVAVTVPHNSR